MTSLDDEVYVDFLGEFTAGIYGHSNAAIAAAVSEAMKKGWNYGGPNTYERELAKKVGVYHVLWSMFADWSSPPGHQTLLALWR